MNALELSCDYHPKGFERSGLVARSLPLRFRSNASPAALKRRVESWESDHGNDAFALRNAHKVPTELAFELTTAYVALRERFPSVCPEYLDLAAPLGDAVLAVAWQYALDFPMLRYLGVSPTEVEDLEEALAFLDAHERRRLGNEIDLSAEVVDPSAAGGIEVSSLFASRRRYRKLVKFWSARNERAQANGRPVRIPPIVVSPATFVLVHEFGHLVDAELLDTDFAAAEHLYAALSFCVFGKWPTSSDQWRHHLINYPTLNVNKGPKEGGSARRRDNKQTLRYPIGFALTKYAATSRDELFAEAFALLFCAADQEQRESLAPFRQALRDTGVLRRLPHRV